MTATYITTHTIGAGFQHTYAAAGDELVILPGVTLASTTSAALGGTALNNLSLSVFGTLAMQSMQEFSGTGANIYIGASGSLLSHEPDAGNAAIYMSGDGGRLVNDGSVTAQQSIGILASGATEIVNDGSIAAASGVFLGLGGASGDSVVNSGTIAASSFDDANRNHRFNNGVFGEGLNTRISNLATGVITAVSSAGAGVRLNATAGGSVVENHGQIVSQQDYGVNFSTIDSGQAAVRLLNTGTISGLDGAFNGSVNGDQVVNSGQLNGHVNLGNGANIFTNTGLVTGNVSGGFDTDVFDLRGGWVTGFVIGGDGGDIYRLDRSDIVISESFLDAGIDAVESTVTHALGVGLENLHLAGAENINGYGNSSNNSIYGNSGSNLLDGGFGNDFLSGGLGHDTLIGGAGDDFLASGEGNDLLDDGEGNDTVNGDIGDDVFIAGAGNDSLDGSSGLDTYDAINATGDTTFNFANATGALGDDTVTGIERYFGGNFADLVTGTAGNDFIVARNGDDTVQAGAGNDYTDGGDGVDTVSYSTAAAAVRVTLGLAGVQNTLGAGFDTVLNFEHITGSAFNDTLRGSSADNFINGGSGNDFLVASTGADTITAGTGTLDTYDAFWATGALYFDFVSMSGAMGDHVVSGVERFYASNYNDTIAGSAVNDIVAGRFGNDNISLGAGNDFIDGGGGNDTLTGGAGNDSFQFLTAGFLPGDADIITDFGTTGGSNDDILRLQGSSANYGFADIAGGVRVTHTASGATIDVMNAGLTAGALSAETVYI